MSWLGLTLSILATWRLCHLVASEDGPFDLIAALRRRVGEGGWGQLMDCPYCLSLWFAVPFAAWQTSRIADGAAAWLAISGGACLVEQAAAFVRARTSGAAIDLFASSPVPPDKTET